MERDVYPFSGGESVTVGVKQFDPTLGQLNNVAIYVDVTQTAPMSFSFENLSDHPLSVTAVYGSVLYLSAPGVFSGRLNPYLSIWGGTAPVGAFDGRYDSAGPDYVVIAQNRLLSAYNGFIIYSGGTYGPSSYIGTSRLPLTVSIATGSLGSSGNLYPMYTGKIRGTLEVDYTYTASAIPEPSSAALLGVGALASLARAVRRGRAARRTGAGAAPGTRAPRRHRGSAPS